MVEVFNLRTNELVGQGCSQPICDSSSKVKVYWLSKYKSVILIHMSCFKIFPSYVFTLLTKRSTVLWTSTLHFPCAAVPRVAARCYLLSFYLLSPYFPPFFTLFLLCKVFMVCDSALAKDVEPRFQIYHQGRHLEDKDDLLQQPRSAGGQQVWHHWLLIPFYF